MTNDEWNPGEKYQLYLAKIQGILGEERRTVRDVYYALEARGFPAELARHGHDFEYRYVKRAVKKGRRHGYIDPGLIYDASRPPENVADDGHGSPESFISKHVDGVWRAYRENFWDDQSHHVEVWLEKQSLASVFAPICEEYNVRLEATRGDWSDSKVYEAAQRLSDRVDAEDDVRIIYWGDFNPSGMHAPVAVQRTMSYYGLGIPRDFEGEAYFDIWPFSGPVGAQDSDGTVAFERRGLNLEHIQQFDLPENPTPSSTDKDRDLRERFMLHVSDGKDVNIELNALKEFEREFLEQELRDSIEQYIDEDAREETRERVRNRRNRIEQAINVDRSAL